MVVNAIPCAMPPPKPWMPRNTINCVMLPAAPQSALPATKMATPASRNGLRPYMSESFPTIGTTTVAASM